MGVCMDCWMSTYMNCVRNSSKSNARPECMHSLETETRRMALLLCLTTWLYYFFLWVYNIAAALTISTWLIKCCIQELLEIKLNLLMYTLINPRPHARRHAADKKLVKQRAGLISDPIKVCWLRQVYRRLPAQTILKMRLSRENRHAQPRLQRCNFPFHRGDSLLKYFRAHYQLQNRGARWCYRRISRTVHSVSSGYTSIHSVNYPVAARR